MVQTPMHIDRYQKKPGTNPQFSVVMPVYDCERYVNEALQSILSQKDCVAEIIISDDHSNDSTLERVMEVARLYEGRHGIRVLRSPNRLGIDHVRHLVAFASCKFIIQAHGDDVSYPSRCRRLFDLWVQHSASLITSNATVRDGVKVLSNEKFPGGWIEQETVIATNPGMLSGAFYGFTKDIFEKFKPLDSSRLAIGHDVILPFRASLLNGVWYEAEALLDYRQHPKQWTKQLWDMQSENTHRFGFLLNRLNCIQVMRNDTIFAGENGTIQKELLQRTLDKIDLIEKNILTDFLNVRSELRQQGLEPLWVSSSAISDSNNSPGWSRYNFKNKLGQLFKKVRLAGNIAY